MTTTRILASLAVAFLGTVAIAGCAQSTSADESFEDTIPAALQASELGITEAFADQGVDGLTTHIMVGATFDRSDLSTADVKKFVSLIVANNTVSVRYLLLVPEDPDGEEIDIVPQLEELGAEPTYGTWLQITLDEAVAIAEGNTK